MNLTRRATLLLLMGVAVVFAYKNFSRAGQETVVLRTIGVRHEDHFATIWVVDDRPHVWIRAENRKRRWLGSVRGNPDVELRRGGQTFPYHATLFDTAEAKAYVDELFREKYGFADWIRGLLGDRDTLPIRLDPR